MPITKPASEVTPQVNNPQIPRTSELMARRLVLGGIAPVRVLGMGGGPGIGGMEFNLKRSDYASKPFTTSP